MFSLFIFTAHFFFLSLRLFVFFFFFCFFDVFFIFARVCVCVCVRLGRPGSGEAPPPHAARTRGRVRRGRGKFAHISPVLTMMVVDGFFFFSISFIWAIWNLLPLWNSREAVSESSLSNLYLGGCCLLGVCILEAGNPNLIGVNFSLFFFDTRRLGSFICLYLFELRQLGFIELNCYVC